MTIILFWLGLILTIVISSSIIRKEHKKEVLGLHIVDQRYLEIIEEMKSFMLDDE